jgi:hypothetical protein
METKKNLGIWMDHSIAHLIETDSKKDSRSIVSKFSFSMKQDTLSKSEETMHNKEQQMHEAYYKKIGDEILKYDHVLLFGPTKAKAELRNYLSKDLHFKDIKIDVEPTDKISPNEKYAFVKNHFDTIAH